MLRALFAGLRRLFGYAYSFVFWPFALFGGGRCSTPGPDMAAVKAAEQSVATARAAKDSVVQSTFRDLDFKRDERDSERDAQIAWSWCTTNLLTRQSMPFPSAMSKKMQSWLQGLDHSQLESLQKAGAVGISAHVAGKQITGVPRVGPLAPVMLKFPPLAKPDAELSDFAFSLSR
jgi:hypothetical protein